MTRMGISIILSIVCLLCTIWIHVSGLSLIRQEIGQRFVSEKFKLVIVVTTAIFLYITEILFYAGTIWFLDSIVNAGDIVGARDFSGMDYVYYSAETSTGLGFGDLSATGGLRILA